MAYQNALRAANPCDLTGGEDGQGGSGAQLSRLIDEDSKRTAEIEKEKLAFEREKHRDAERRMDTEHEDKKARIAIEEKKAEADLIRAKNEAIAAKAAADAQKTQNDMVMFMLKMQQENLKK